MIELQQLRQLIAVSEHGTMSGAAREMHISQPALTRSMQRLEQNLAVELFDRRKNRTSLNEVGLLAVELSRRILRDVDSLPQRLGVFSRNLNTISIGSCAPAPMWNLASELMEFLPDNAFNSEIQPYETLLEGLVGNKYHLIITDRPVALEGILCRTFARERLVVSVPADHPLGDRDGVFLEELAGQTMLVYHETGIWDRVIRTLEGLGAHFIVQQDKAVLADLVNASGIPCLGSNLLLSTANSARRITVPILDEEAAAVYYLSTSPRSKAFLDRLTFPRTSSPS